MKTGREHCFQGGASALDIPSPEFSDSDIERETVSPSHMAAAKCNDAVLSTNVGEDSCQAGVKCTSVMSTMAPVGHRQRQTLLQIAYTQLKVCQ